jgi:hypothetical protein
LARKAVAKFLGLAFYKLGKECLVARGSSAALEGPCCGGHCLDGLIQAHAMFGEMLKSFADAKVDLSSLQTTIDATLVELKTRIVKGSLLQGVAASDDKASSAERLLSHLISTHFRVEGEPSQYLIQNLNARADALRRVIRESKPSGLESELNAKYSDSLFERGLRNTLKSMYELLPELRLHQLVKFSEQQTARLQTAALSPAQSPVKPVSMVPVQEVPEALPLAAKGAKIARPVASEAAPRDSASTVISGRFFRGVLEPSDHRFATIADGTHPEVRAYLLERKRRAASQAIRMPDAKTRAVKGVNARAVESASPKGHNLLERHDSAEKIGWESQSQYSSGVKKARVITETAPMVAARTVSVSVPIVKAEQIPTRASSPGQIVLDEGGLQWPSAGFDSRGMLPSGSRERRKFTEQETNNLIQGILNFGHDWRRIQQHYSFNDRTNVDLKDKARTLRKQGLL